MSSFVTFHDNNGRHYVRRAGILYAFTMDQPDPNASMVNQRSWYLTIEYDTPRTLTFVFHREESRDKIRDLLVPPAIVERV